MVNKSECSKKFKHLCDRTVSLTIKEVRTAKDYLKLLTNYATIEDLTRKNKKEIDSVNLKLQTETQILDALIQLNKERSDKLEIIKEEIEGLEEKIKTIEDNESQESERSKTAQLRHLQFLVLKMCTNTYINDKKIPRTLQGFAATEKLSTIPFSVDAVRLTKSEIQDALWASCNRCSGFRCEWDHLFASDGSD